VAPSGQGLDKTGKTRKTEGFQNPIEKAGYAATDRVDLSNLAQGLTKLALESPKHSYRVQELTALYESGRYNIEPNKVSASLIESMH